ncbi:MAG: GTP-binding protein [Methanomassiliicoccales archaeon]|jgi:G3E family GTPase|nr:GTP-binding protein [Methanomassiliicoccales archaeon]
MTGDELRNPVRIAIIGGFLGAGKSSMAMAVGKFLMEKENALVAVITNDQGNVLVDTEFMRSGGFDVEEIRGGCFCVNFEEFVRDAQRLAFTKRPDLIIAESIGTATNLLAAVISPLKELYPQDFEIAPLFVVVDCQATYESLNRKEDSSTLASLIPVQQIKEAEIIVLSKCDLVEGGQLDAVIEYIKNLNQEAMIIPYSFITKMNVERIAELMISEKKSTKKPLEVDQRIFAREKAMLGWCNYSAEVRADERVDARTFLIEIMKGIAEHFESNSLAHVKAILSSTRSTMKLSLVGDRLRIDDLRGERFFIGEGKLVINARVCSTPEELKKSITTSVKSSSKAMHVTILNEQEVAFVPKPEMPSNVLKIQ